jgi:hypothetical protein
VDIKRLLVGRATGPFAFGVLIIPNVGLAKQFDQALYLTATQINYVGTRDVIVPKNSVANFSNMLLGKNDLNNKQFSW